MIRSDETRDAAQRNSFALFPQRSWICGAISARHIARLFFIYGLVALAGFWLAHASINPHWQAFGLGIMFPGGGFYSHADCLSEHGIMHFLMAIVGLLSFLAAIIVWFATGNALAPPTVWLMFALAAASMQHGNVQTSAMSYVGSLIFIIFGLSILKITISSIFDSKKRCRANIYLLDSGTSIAAGFLRQTSPESNKFGSTELKLMRFHLDRALQPLEEFNGFQWRDQFQTAAVRYQINFIGYALSMAQATQMPAFSGYLQEAQHQVIKKQTDYRIWQYWALENLWGNFDINPDPIARDNIMFTGFVALQMAMYHAASGQRDFLAAGSFELKHPSKKITFAYDLPALIATLDQETHKSAFHLIACEPNWIYPLCNMIGASAIMAQAPEVWAKHAPHFRKNLENEFINMAGNIVPCRSRYTGFALPNIGGAMPQAMPCFFLNAIMPDIAMRQWLHLRRSMMTGNGLRREIFWRIDTGDYRFSRAAAYAAVALAAAELGDEEVKILCLAALDEECPMHNDNSKYYRTRASVWAHAVEFLARCTPHNGFQSLMHRTHKSVMTPHISEAKYPEALVTRALYHDGRLSADIHPGGKTIRQTIGISGLVPNMSYKCAGAEECAIVADVAGSAKLNLILNKTIELQIWRST